MTDTSSPGAAPAAPGQSHVPWWAPLFADARGWLAAAFVGVLIWSLWLLGFVTIPPANKDLFVFIVGQVVGASMLAIVNWYFGSSKGSSAKDDTIATLAKGEQP